MQILRIILMVCFVFTVYPSIGEAVDIEAVDIGEGSKTKSTLKATTSHPLSLNIDPNTEKIKTAPDVEEGGDRYSFEPHQQGEPIQSVEGLGEPTHLNERILQLQKKELDKSLDTSIEDDGY